MIDGVNDGIDDGEHDDDTNDDDVDDDGVNDIVSDVNADVNDNVKDDVNDGVKIDVNDVHDARAVRPHRAPWRQRCNSEPMCWATGCRARTSHRQCFAWRLSSWVVTAML